MSGSAIVLAAYLIYALAAIGLFACRPARQAGLIAYFGGWLFLPVARYTPESLTAGGFTLDVIGTVLPSNLLLTKALIIPLVVIAGLLIRDPAAVRRIRPGPLDLAVVLFCLSPFLSFAAQRITLDSALFQAGYLAGIWGGTWVMGRMVLSDDAGRLALVQAIAGSGLCLLPVALVEGLNAPQLYPLVYGGHPFASDGMQRYYGTRPLAFFEHGNQYGMWIAMAALAAFHLARRPAARSAPLMIAAALLLAACAVASQSIGAILLLLLGGAWMMMSKGGRRIVVIAGAVLIATGSIAYLSGKDRMERLAYGTPFGQSAMAALKSTGRGSLSWRVHRDLESLQTIAQAPITGHGHWDWWRPLGGHPWGLTLLLAGQFGLISVLLLACAMLAGAIRALWLGSAGILPVIVVLSVIDAQLNSFIYVPAILAAAAIGDPFRRTRATASHRAAPSSTRIEPDNAH